MYSDNFFLFASDKKNAVQSRIYGYVFQNDCVVNNTAMPAELHFSSNATGAFSCVKEENGGLQIFTDPVGFGMVFYIKAGLFWACSNSFHMLFEYVKDRQDLILNNRYISLFYENTSIAALSF